MERKNWKMISNIKRPTKSELVKNIQNLKNPKIDVFEVFDNQHKTNLVNNINNYLRFGHLSVIIVRN